jgi:mannose-6-phosphate isomerase
MQFDTNTIAHSSVHATQTVEPYPLKFAPLPHERLWGGHQLKSWFSCQDNRPIGEFWVLSAHPSAVSVVQNGVYRGMRLDELTRIDPEAYLGQSPQQRFPLLIKFIEAQEDLSVQVHPDDEYALQRENDFGKTEAWYIVDAGENGEIIYGHTFQNKEHYFQCVQNRTIQNHLKRRQVHNDDLVFVPAGTLHAILKGTILLEIQQTSDVTYRVYDWDRLDSTGKPRPLHMQKAADVMHFGPDSRSRSKGVDTEIRPIFQSDPISHVHLLTCPYFTIERLELKAGSRYVCPLGRKGNPDVLIGLNGTGSVFYQQRSSAISIQKGDTLLIPGTFDDYQIQADTDMKLIRTFY